VVTVRLQQFGESVIQSALNSLSAADVYIRQIL
jgi:hypothetical protein